MPTIIESHEQERECGFRQAGGTYLVCPPGDMVPCGKLPIPLVVCPCCGEGIKFSRGWTWVDFTELAREYPCCAEVKQCKYCPLANLEGRVGMLWVGEKTYKTPHLWTAEAERMGVSRRVSGVPRDFRLGEHWVVLAHMRVIPLGSKAFGPAIFHAFRPTRIEYIVTGEEKEETLEALEARGITLVRVVPVDAEGNVIGEDLDLTFNESEEGN